MRLPLFLLGLVVALALPACGSFQQERCPPALVDEGGNGPSKSAPEQVTVGEALLYVPLALLLGVARNAAWPGCHCLRAGKSLGRIRLKG